MELNHIIVLLILLGCMATYIPVFMCLFFTAVISFLVFTDLPLLLLAQSLLRSLDKFALVVVLFFVLCGNIFGHRIIICRVLDNIQQTISTIIQEIVCRAFTGRLACLIKSLLENTHQPRPVMTF